MKITLAKSAGFCFGVRKAIKIAFETCKSKATVEMLGDIVHNEEVINKINAAGVKRIKLLRNGHNKILLIRAHGASRKTFLRAKKLGYKIVDATCPMVKEIHKIARRMESKGYKIIIIGDKQHDEVQGIIGQLNNKAVVIDNIKTIPVKTLKGFKKAAVVVQSTQNSDKVKAIVNILNQYVKNLKFFNTICAPTRQKQNEMKTMPLENDIMIIIGSKSSANTKRLYEIAKSLNRRTYWIQSKYCIKPNWFKNARRIGITAGASTPDTTTQEVINYIKTITNKKNYTT
jgi:4-hydroxy-3-methylbut-2-enyl diphosphate reductase